MPSSPLVPPIRASRSLPALALALLSALLPVATTSCATGAKAKQAAPAKREAPTLQAARDLQFTETSEIQFSGEVVGYLVDVLPVPEGIVDDRPWEPGTALIQDTKFQFMGFVSPRGTTYHFDPDGNPRVVGWGSRIDGIAAFFKRNGKPQFVALGFAAPPPPGSTPAPAKDASEEPAEPDAPPDS